MNTTSTRHFSHLSDDQLDDVMIGDLAAGPATHLTQCAECKARLQAARAPIASFKAVSMAWSERQSATVPATLLRAVSSMEQRRANRIAVAMAALLVAVSIPLTMREKHTQIVASGVTASQSAKGPVARVEPGTQARVQPAAAHHNHPASEIAQDNEMLQAIDRELDASVQPPSDSFGLMAVGGAAAGHGRYAPLQTWD